MKFANGLKILLADDNQINQRLAGFVFKQLDLTCDFASDGAEAVRRYSEKPYDLIFMDLKMPVMDGLESSQKIREIEQASGSGHRAVIIALSASEQLDVIADCKQSGMDDYMEKPVQNQKLLDILNRYFA